MSRLLLLLAFAPFAEAQAQTRIGVSADVGYTRVNLAGGLGPSVGVHVRHGVSAGAIVAAVRLDVLFIDREALAAGYTFAAGACSDADGPVDPYVCNDLETPGTSPLGAYSAEVAYAPSVPVAVGVGVRFGEEVDREDGKRFGVARPYATVIGTRPATRNVAIQARARVGIDLIEARLGVAVLF